MRLIKLAAAAVSLCASTSALAFPIADPGTEGFLVIAGANAIIAKYEGNSAAYSNDLWLVNTGTFVFNNHLNAVGDTVDLGTFAAGTELLFRLHVNNTGFDYFTGPASRNPDSHTHARVQSDWQPGTTLVSFEDLYNGPFDYNDLSFSFTNTIGRDGGALPEPATWAMMLLGFGLVGGALRSAKRRQKLKASLA
jgi:hypothetical protein